MLKNSKYIALLYVILISFISNRFAYGAAHDNLAGAVLGKVLSKAPVDIDDVTDAFSGNLANAASEAAANIKQYSGSGVIKQPEIFVKVGPGEQISSTQIKNALTKENYTNAELLEFAGDLEKMMIKGEHTWLTACNLGGRGNVSESNGTGNRSSGGICLAGAWKAPIVEVCNFDVSYFKNLQFNKY